MFEDVAIGSIFLIPYSKTHCGLESFFIYTEYQGNGYGSKTLEEMVK